MPTVENFSIEQLKEVGVYRRLLYYRWGRIVFHPLFDLGLRVVEVVEREQSGQAMIEEVFELSVPTEKEVKEELWGRVLSEGAQVLEELGTVIAGIRRDEDDPSDVIRQRVAFVHFKLTWRLNRPPTQTELRRAVWEDSERRAFLDQARNRRDDEKLSRHLGGAWEYQGEEGNPRPLTPIQDDKNFAKLVRNMGLVLTDGNAFRSYRSRFKDLQHRLNRKPSLEEFSNQIAEDPKLGAESLEEKELEDLVELVASHVATDTLGRWIDSPAFARIIDDALAAQRTAKSDRKCVQALFWGIMRCGLVLDVLKGGVSHSEVEKIPVTVSERFEQLLEAAGRLPRFTDFYCKAECSEFRSMMSDLDLREEEVQAMTSVRKSWGHLNAREAKVPTIKELAQTNESLKLALPVLDDIWRRRLAFAWYDSIVKAV